jgi:arylsulfatase A-like enzyme
MHNHYRNSVRQQERTVAAFLRELRASPRWNDTAVIFLSDHGEEFREHRKLYHLHNVFDEEVRVPGWLLAGPRAVDSAQRAALGTFTGQRTYSQDVQATVIDLLGLFEQRGALPFASMATGRSLLRPRPSVEPAVPISTTSGVWEADDPVYGVRRGELMLVGYDTLPFACFDSRIDPGQYQPLPVEACGTLIEDARKLFPAVPAK